MTWPIFLAAAAASFLILEAVAITKNRETLSQFMRASGRRWPLLLFWFGLGCGFLAAHFWGQGCV